MTLTACQKDEVSPSAGATSQTITVSIPQGVQTRAAAADFGDGSQIDRCLLQIYRNGQPYGEQQTATVTGNTATFNLRLVAQQKYDFVFWADCSEAGYETDDLSAITLGSDADYTGNDDKFDAFFLCKKDYTVTESFSETFTLRRPFGQLNVKTLDLAAIPDNAADLKPAKVKRRGCRGIHGRRAQRHRRADGGLHLGACRTGYAGRLQDDVPRCSR